MIAAQPLDLVGATAAVPSAASSSAASAAGAASRASATSTVRLPSTRSSPAGLPVVAGSPYTPSRSSRSWKASPSGSPNAVSSRQRRRGRRRRGRRRCGAAARWSTWPTCSAAPSSRCRRRRGRGPGRRRRGTGRRSPRCGTGRRRRGPGHDLLGGSPQRRSSSSDHDSSRSPSRIARGRAVLLRVAAPPGAAVLALEGAVRRRPAAAGVGGVHVVVVHQRARVQQLQRGAGPDQRVARRSASAPPRGGPTSRTTPGTACRRRPTYGPRRRSRAASGPSGASRSACSSRNASSAVWTPVAEAVPGPTRRSRRDA